MDLATLITDDHTIFDGIHTVTLKNADGTQSDSVAYVTSGVVGFKALQLIGGGLADNSQLQSFSLPAANCAFAPKIGYTITNDDSVVWRILSIDQKTLDSRYVCNCVRDKLELSTPLAISSPTISTTAGVGAISISWTETSGATSYRVEVAATSAFTSPTTTSGTIASILSGTSASTSITGLTGGTWYVRVRRSNALGNSPWSDVESLAVTVNEVQKVTFSATPAFGIGTFSGPSAEQTEVDFENDLAAEQAQFDGSMVGDACTVARQSSLIHTFTFASGAYAHTNVTEMTFTPNTTTAPLNTGDVTITSFTQTQIGESGVQPTIYQCVFSTLTGKVGWVDLDGFTLLRSQFSSSGFTFNGATWNCSLAGSTLTLTTAANQLATISTATAKLGAAVTGTMSTVTQGGS